MKIKKYFPFFSDLHLNYYRVMHGIKTAIACVVGVAIEKYYEWPMGQWIPITIMVVMSAQPHFGGAVRKAYMRFLGTIGGVTIVVATLWLFGTANLPMIFCTVFFASILFAYIASSHGDINYAGTLGGVTVILVLTGQHICIITAIQRGCYIVIGIIIALLVSRFIFPLHARDRLRYHVASALRNLGKLYFAAVKSIDNPENNDEYIIAELHTKAATDIAAQPRLIHEAIAGSRAFAIKKPIFNDILNSEQCLNRLINLICIDLRNTKPPAIVSDQLSSIEELNTTIANSLSYLANCFEAMEQPHTMVDLDGALASIADAVDKLPKIEDPQLLIVEHSFLFFMEQILKELENLRKLIIKVNGKHGDSMV